MAEYQILYWRDIPAQVRVFTGRRPLSRPLPDRFQQAIDRTAMAEGLAGTDDYLAQWRWTEKRTDHGGDPEELLHRLIEELAAAYDAANPA